MQEHEAWLKKALSDLKSSKMLINDPDTIDNASYHTQQCAEKALKGFLRFHNHPIIKTHDLQKLLELCIKIESAFEIIKLESITLIPYAIYSRYPDNKFYIDYQEALQAIQYAEKIFNFVKTKIAEKTDPNMRLF